MQAGDKVTYIPFVLRYAKDTELRAPTVTAPVVWVHPEGRFAVVERRTGRYAYRECIPCDNRKKTKSEVRASENDRNHEPEGRRGQDRHGPQFGRRAAAGR